MRGWLVFFTHFTHGGHCRSIRLCFGNLWNCQKMNGKKKKVMLLVSHQVRQLMAKKSAAYHPASQSVIKKAAKAANWLASYTWM